MATSRQVDSDTDNADAVSKQISGYDEESGIWLEEFSLLLNYVFPVEFIFNEWYIALENNEIFIMNNCNLMMTGSTIEGFSIPFCELTQDRHNIKQQFASDFDIMSIKSHSFQSCITGIDHPVFSVEHAPDDARYIKLRITREFRCEFRQFKNVEFLNHALMFDSNTLIACQKSEKAAILTRHVKKGLLGDSNRKKYNDTQLQDKVTNEIHGPVYKESHSGLLPLEMDNAVVFTYPNAWPEKAMEWVDRSAAVRPNNWPSSDLIQEIVQSGCHIAAVGRGKRSRDPMDYKDYMQNPEAAVRDTKANAEIGMDETEWRISFSIAENKLAASVSPIQRHFMILFKMLKKMYFSEISTYILKNLAFWEFERKGGSFWNDNNIAVCLLFMLDQLIQCLKEGFLPHYIMPESNLLEGEDPALLKKAADAIVKTRKNILQRTVSMMTKLGFFTYEGDYISEFHPTDIALNIENKNRKDEEKLTVKKKICNMLARMYTIRLISYQTWDVQAIMNNVLESESLKLVWQSVLARLFCHIYDLNRNQESLEDIVVDGTQFLPDANRIMIQSKEYLHGMANGNELSYLVPTNAAMINIRDIQRCLTWSCDLSIQIVFHDKKRLLQINDHLEVVKDFVENDLNLKRRFKGLEKVKLIVMAMIYIEELLRENIKEAIEKF